MNASHAAAFCGPPAAVPEPVSSVDIHHLYKTGLTFSDFASNAKGKIITSDRDHLFSARSCTRKKDDHEHRNLPLSIKKEREPLHPFRKLSSAPGLSKLAASFDFVDLDARARHPRRSA